MQEREAQCQTNNQKSTPNQLEDKTNKQLVENRKKERKPIMVVPPLTARGRLSAQLDQCNVIRNRCQIEMFIHSAAPDAKVHGTRFRSSGQILCTQTHQGQRGIDAVR